MSDALPGEHYCEKHQGNHSHYDESNCTVCKLEELVEALGDTHDEFLDDATHAVNNLCKKPLESEQLTALNTVLTAFFQDNRQ